MKERTKILLIDDEETGREALTLLLKAAGHAVKSAGAGSEAFQTLTRDTFDIVITDLFLPDASGIDILKKVKEDAPLTEVILITGHASAETAVKAMKEGAFDYITKPLNFDELKIIIGKAVEKRQLLSENVYLRKQLRDKFEFANIIGSSPAMQHVFALMKRIVKTDSTVLIAGESGTGKELVAKAIHFNGGRRDKPFIAVHCGAIPENLLESELFGYVKGAFTGAMRDKIGKFEAANGGTIFLDEIGTMPMQLQTKLLRVLQEEEVERVGSTRPVKIDVRIISATNLDLAEEVKKGNFREDLFYRLNVIPLQLPPLRERVEDILPLAKHFLAKYCKEMQRRNMSLASDTLEALESYQWPGNVRELENVMERVAALTEDNTVTVQDLPHNIREEGLTRLTGKGVDLVKVLAEIERGMIRDALVLSEGVKARAAALLNLNRTTLVEKMRRLGMPL
ncbi:sigma-54-dependent Fis family transcriptional regulator [Geobacter sulfurreducens]|jgi:two-component system response regulator AtoC|uniref:Sigma-54-dependent transcriptional response regulator n=1 Tax=Geobacter sulfurreducens (strain ATCC 51573 / DSM 12127 / PCA) TaxID=243231 RepID=Q74E35_GEOSL|nr:sigma-54 dependent transcriptional regulator [Geobacter sulfurreducens]AAR34505.1 sigma-54-dependent transcriptional response regulator [Geobacter sulfurreducens PCA]ADI83966.1 sigma-54-dependent transcriptional response regulator [Geobacter sulfurreducens KN400]AJY70850.1 Fis family transcriptional regulator [Geobacter sulfurreducens]QVW36355.1 sigma-54-dependent Fis family transcriptional regulator [Geobacter sulfurreducens]UAC05170.1 sigma-54 dependent transcriptional regulator [Geobacte